MRTIIIIATFLLAYSSSKAQSEVGKVVTQIKGSSMSWVFNYSENGYLTSVADGQGVEGEVLWSFDYNASIDGLPYIQQYGYFLPDGNSLYINQEPTFIRESKLDNNHLISNDKNGNTFMWSTGESFDYYYSDGRMVRITGENGIVMDISWENGNLTQIVFIESEEEVGRISCSYNELSAKGIFKAFTSPLLHLLDYYTILPIGTLMHGYYGLLNKNLLTEMSISFSDEFIKKHKEVDFLSADHYPIIERESRKYRYETDTEGNVTKISVSEEEHEMEYLFYYENNGLSSCQPTDYSVDRLNLRIDLQGRQLSNTQMRKGAYIQNGRKVVR